MRIYSKFLLAGLVTGLAMSATALADGQKIAVVDSQRLLAEAPQARAALTTLEAEFGPRGKTLEAQKKDLESRAQKFERDQATMSEAERTKTQRDVRDTQVNFERRLKEFQEDVQLRQNEELQKVQKSIYEAVRVFGKSQGYDIVLLAGGVIYNADAVDITPQVLSSLQAKASAPAAAAPTKK